VTDRGGAGRSGGRGGGGAFPREVRRRGGTRGKRRNKKKGCGETRGAPGASRGVPDPRRRESRGVDALLLSAVSSCTTHRMGWPSGRTRRAPPPRAILSSRTARRQSQKETRCSSAPRKSRTARRRRGNRRAVERLGAPAACARVDRRARADARRDPPFAVPSGRRAPACARAKDEPRADPRERTERKSTVDELEGRGLPRRSLKSAPAAGAPRSS